MQVHHDVVPGLRVQRREGGVDPVGAGRQRRIGQDRDASGRPYRLGDLGLGAGDGDRADLRLASAVEHVRDHRPAVDVGERLAG